MSTPTQRFLWTMVVFALLVLEVRSINKDHIELARAREQELEAFNGIAQGIRGASEGIQKSVQQSQNQFGQTMRKENSIEESAKESINIATGGNSFCYMQFTGDAAHGRAPVVAAVGKYPLYDVAVMITDLSMLPPQRAGDAAQYTEALQQYFRRST